MEGGRAGREEVMASASDGGMSVGGRASVGGGEPAGVGVGEGEAGGEAICGRLFCRRERDGED